MIVVDSSVWIDYFRNVNSAEVDVLDGLLLGRRSVALGDLILAEVLQGTRTEREFDQVLTLFASLPVVVISDTQIAIAAARNYRRLRELGLTVRKTIDTLVATRCIRDDHALLFRDRDFHPFVEHLGLRSALAD